MTFRRISRAMAVCACGAVAAATAAGCGSDPAGQQQQQAAKPTEVVLGSVDTPQSLDINGPNATHQQSQEAMANVWAPLTDYEFEPFERDGRIQVPKLTGFRGHLAESWEVSDDETEYTFTLKDVESQYGNRLTSEDVVWTVKRDFELAAFAAFFWRTAGVTGPDKVSAPDERTVVFKLEEPSSLFLQVTSSWFTGIADSTEAKKQATESDPWAKEWFARNPAGFGPWRVENWADGSEIIFSAWDGYWDAEAMKDAPKRLIYRKVPSSSNRFLFLQRGEINVNRETTAVERQRLANEGNVSVLGHPGSEISFVTMQDVEPFDDPRVRQAIAYALPYQAVLDTVYSGDRFARRGTSLLPDEYVGWTDEGWTFGDGGDVERAKQLLAEAGYPNGIDIEPPLVYSLVQAQAEAEASVIRTGLAEAGIRVKLEGLNPVRYEEFEQKKQIEFSLNGTGTPFLPDAEFAAGLYWTCDAVSGVLGYCSTEVDAVVAQAKEAPTEEERLELFGQVQEMLLDDVAAIPYVQPGHYWTVTKGLAGIRWYPDRLIRFQDLTWTDK